MVRVQKHGTRRDFGLGSASKVSLKIARERAREVRTWVELGLDPLLERRKAQGMLYSSPSGLKSDIETVARRELCDRIFLPINRIIEWRK